MYIVSGIEYPWKERSIDTKVERNIGIIPKVLMVSLQSTDGTPLQYLWYPFTVLMVSPHDSAEHTLTYWWSPLYSYWTSSIVLSVRSSLCHWHWHFKYCNRNNLLEWKITRIGLEPTMSWIVPYIATTAHQGLRVIQAISLQPPLTECKDEPIQAL